MKNVLDFSGKVALVTGAASRHGISNGERFRRGRCGSRARGL